MVADSPAGERTFTTREMIWAFLVALVLITVVALPPVSNFSARNLVGLIVGVLALLTFVALWSRRAQGMPVGLVVGWLVFLAYGVSILASEGSRNALEASVGPLVAVALFVTVSTGILSARVLAVGVVIVGLVVALITLTRFLGQLGQSVTLLRVANPEAGIWDVLSVAPPRASFVGHPNLTAMFLYVGAITAAALSSTGIFRVGAGLAAVLMFGTILTTGSRGGLIAASVGLVVTVLLVARGSRESLSWKVRRIALAAVAVAVVVVPLFLWLTGQMPAFIFRGTLQDRIPVMAAGLEMFGDNPWFGNGPGTFTTLFPLYAGDLYPGVEARLVWSSAHNGYVQMLQELGLIGVLLVATGLISVVVVAWKLIREGDGEQRMLAGVLIGVMAAFLLHNLTDSLSHLVGPLALVGVVSGATVMQVKLGNISGAANVALAVPVTAAVAVLVVLTVGAHSSYESGWRAAVQGDYSTAASWFREAADADSLPVYGQALSLAQGQLGDPSFDPDIGFSYMDVPVSVVLNDAQIVAADDPRRAARLLDQALPWIAGDEVALIHYGSVSLEIEEDEEALWAFSEAVRINPWLSSSPLLDDLPSDMRREVLDSAFEDRPCEVGDIWVLNTAVTDQQLEFLATECDQSSGARMMAEVELGEADSVYIRAVDGLGSSPDSMELRRIAGVAAIELGQVDDARVHWSYGTLQGDSYSALRLALSYEQPPVPVLLMLNQLSAGHSPVLLDVAPAPAYRLAAVRMASSGHRRSLPSTLIDGDWQEAYSLLHVEIQR